MNYIDRDRLLELVGMFDRQIPPGEAFELAQTICGLAYEAQGGSTQDPDVYMERQDAREARKATPFEKLYCKLRQVGDDWHQEAKRRHSGAEKGLYTRDMLDANRAAEAAFQSALNAVNDWDY